MHAYRTVRAPPSAFKKPKDTSSSKTNPEKAPKGKRKASDDAASAPPPKKNKTASSQPVKNSASVVTKAKPGKGADDDDDESNDEDDESEDEDEDEDKDEDEDEDEDNGMNTGPAPATREADIAASQDPVKDASPGNDENGEHAAMGPKEILRSYRRLVKDVSASHKGGKWTVTYAVQIAAYMQCKSLIAAP